MLFYKIILGYYIMLRYHSASEGMIVHLREFARRRTKEKNRHDFTNTEQRIFALEQKLIEYEKRKAENLCNAIYNLSTPYKPINLLDIYKNLNILI